MVWVAAGAVITGYIFYATTPNYISADIIGVGIIGFSAGPAAVQIAAVLALVAWLALPLPVLIAGFIRLRGWRAANWLRAAAWAGAWIAGGAPLGAGRGLVTIPTGLLPTSTYARHCGANAVPLWQPCRGELGRAGNLSRVAGARGPR